MDDAISSDVLNNSFSFWPINKGSVVFILTVFVIIALIFFIKAMRKHYLTKAHYKVINRDWIILISMVVALSLLILVNGSRIHKTMATASKLSDTLTLNGDKLVVIPDFPNSQKYFVLDDYKPIATINSSGYHALSKKGKALHKLSKVVYTARYTLKSNQDEGMYGKNNRIERINNHYQINSWLTNGQQVKYSVDVDNSKLRHHKAAVSGLEMVPENNDPNRLPFGGKKGN